MESHAWYCLSKLSGRVNVDHESALTASQPFSLTQHLLTIFLLMTFVFLSSCFEAMLSL